MARKPMYFWRVGHVERGANYSWRDGYSLRPDGGWQPWLTKKEAQSYAKNHGHIAVFLEPANQPRPRKVPL